MNPSAGVGWSGGGVPPYLLPGQNMIRVEHRQLALFAVVVVGAVTFVVYSSILNNDFIGWDDSYYVLNSPYLLPLSFGLIGRIFSSFYFASYSPLSLLSHTLDFNVWGMDPRGHHLTNIMIHALNACMVYILALALYRKARTASAGEDGGGGGIALVAAAVFSALVFALHPLRVESVACVSSRKDLLSASFLIGSTLAYLKDADTRGIWTRRPWYLLALGLYCLSLLAKGSGMSFPGVLLVLDLLLDGGWLSWRRMFVLLREKVPYLALGIGAAVVAYIASEVASEPDIGVRSLPAINRWETGFSTIAFYVVKTVWPSGIAEVYMMTFDWRSILAIAAVLLATAGSVGALVYGRPVWIAMWGAYLAALLPMAGFVPSSIQLISNRYAYVATLPLVLTAGYGLVMALRYARSRRGAQTVVSGVACGAVALLGVLTIRQIPDWRDAESVWKRAMEVSPGHYVSYFNLGNWFQSRQEIDSAIVYFRLALKVAPNSERSLVALGGAYALNKDTTKAEILFQAVRARLPGYAAVYLGLGTVRELQARYDEADSLYAVASSLDPKNPTPLFNRAIVALRREDEMGAVGLLRQALEISPNFANGYYLLGQIRSRRPETRAEGQMLIRKAAMLGSLDAQKVLLGLGQE
jgi:tetratricopeptide (TPR) repeat protein